MKNALWRGGTLAVAIGLGATTPTIAQRPTLADLIKIGGDYVESYSTRASGAVLEEEYRLIELGPRMQVPKRVASDLVFVKVNGMLMTLRDVFAIDSKPVRERTPRLIQALEKPSLAAWQLAQSYSHEAQVHFLSALVVKLSDPAIALQFLARANQEKVRYRIDGNKKMNGVAVVGLRFEEPTGRTAVYHLRTQGNAAASGRFWMDPADGTIHQTELWLESPTEVARITVAYSLHATLNLWLPKETTEAYESRELGAGPSGASSTMNLVHRLETTIRYSNARYQPIDLSKITK